MNVWGATGDSSNCLHGIFLSQRRRSKFVCRYWMLLQIASTLFWGGLEPAFTSSSIQPCVRWCWTAKVLMLTELATVRQYVYVLLFASLILQAMYGEAVENTMVPRRAEKWTLEIYLPILYRALAEPRWFYMPTEALIIQFVDQKSALRQQRKTPN